MYIQVKVSFCTKCMCIHRTRVELELLILWLKRTMNVEVPMAIPLKV
jgi:hypothetical protein